MQASQQRLVQRCKWKWLQQLAGNPDANDQAPLTASFPPALIFACIHAPDEKTFHTAIAHNLRACDGRDRARTSEKHIF
jgi:hypothetical protein